MAAWHNRGRRSRRFRSRQENAEELVFLDYKKDPADNQHKILCNIVKKDGISMEKKLGYLNAFVRFCHRFGSNFGSKLSHEEVVCCLRIGLVHEAKELRAACLRAIRYYVRDKTAVEALITLHVDYLITRSLDVCLDNDIERIHSLRLVRHIMVLHPQRFPPSLLKAMISIANDGVQERDKMVRTCLATICELAFYNPSLMCQHGGTSAVLKNVLNCHQLARINESLLSTVLYLLNHPKSRHNIREDLDIEQVLAPFTDCHFKLPTELPDASGDDNGKFAASKMAIATIVKSWPGLMRMCKPDGSGLQSLLGVLYLPNMETRKEIMDIIFDVFRLPQPEWTNDFSEALVSVDPSEMRESWRLMEGFVAEEGKALLPHLAKTRPNLVENHMALVLAAFVSAGLLESLVEVIVTSEDFISIRATILLGEILYLANAIVPPETSQVSHCLPTLISVATSTKPSPERNRAKRAVICLDRHHTMKKRGLVPRSLYLDQIVRRGAQQPDGRANLVGMEKLQLYVDRESEANLVGSAIRDSQVLATKENASWDWHLVGAILQWADDSLRRLVDQNVVRFVRRLVFFFKPTNRLFSAVETSREDSQLLTVVALQFVEFLLNCDHNEAQKYVEELLGDVAQCLSEIRAQRAPENALFFPSLLLGTLSQDYFLIIGRFSQTPKGEKYLQSTGIYQFLLDLMTITSHDTYIKLIVSSIDSSREGNARLLLSKGLTASSETARLYTANFMRVLLRARAPFFSSWGVEMLVMQLYDQSRQVAMEALSVLSEACEEEVNLLALVKLRPSVLHLGVKGALLLARLLSIPDGFKFLTDANYVDHELRKWRNGFNERYVGIVEERLNEALTTYEITYDGQYTRRSSRRVPRKDVYVPIHVYGQLVQHKAGYKLVEKQEYIREYFERVRSQTLHTDEQILKLKSALWIVGHIGSSVWGLSMLVEENIVPIIIKIAEECGVFSVRGTAFYVLGLVASTSKGAGILSEYGWDSVRHKRCAAWPVIEELDVDVESDLLLSAASSSSSVSTSTRGGDESRGSATPAQLQALFQPPDAAAQRVGSPVRTTPSPKFFLGGDDLPPGTKSRSSTVDSGEGGDVKSQSGGETSPSAKTMSPVMSGASSSENVTNVTNSKTSTLERPNQLTVSRQASSDQATSDSEGFYTPPSRYESATASVDSLDSKHLRSHSDPVSSTARSSGAVFVHFEVDEEPLHASSGFPSGTNCNDVSRQPGAGAIAGTKSAKVVTRGQPHTSSSGSDIALLARTGLRGGGMSGFRDERSGSNESSHTSKSRSDSVNTDITTSGISSFESGPHTVTSDHQQLSPIPSASSISNNEATKTFQFPDKDKPFIHPSDSLRRLANLRRVPSQQRRYSNPSLGHVSPRKISNAPHDSIFDTVAMYTSAKDLRGYATLRELQMRRPVSTEDDNLVNVGQSPYDEGSDLRKTRTLDFRLGRPSSSNRLRNLSCQSLQELEALSTSPYDVLPLSASKEKLKKSARPAGKSEYIGVTLPVDISMLFQVTEGEDPRCALPEPAAAQDEAAAEPPRVAYSRSASQVEPSDGLENHSVNTCLGCVRLRRDDGVFGAAANEPLLAVRPLARHPSTESTEKSRDPSPSTRAGAGAATLRSNAGSDADLMSGLHPGSSVTSTLSVESGNPKFIMSEDSEVGKNLIRKEVMRLIVNLSSSVAVKGTEKGLLSLKQKFPKTYQDICLYSEVCHTLANYNYRLNSRRFVQELFQDVDFSQLFDEPPLFLGSVAAEEANPSEADQKLEKVLESLA